ncbi:hypothetical protein, partial [Nocardia inohanensis]|uniref:hypothetical protein n=1 Tax=Nocardia inohanensis TaxID=209246 RepID=UPI00157C7EE4
MRQTAAQRVPTLREATGGITALRQTARVPTLREPAGPTLRQAVRVTTLRQTTGHTVTWRQPGRPVTRSQTVLARLPLRQAARGIPALRKTIRIATLGPTGPVGVATLRETTGGVTTLRQTARITTLRQTAGGIATLRA